MGYQRRAWFSLELKFNSPLSHMKTTITDIASMFRLSMLMLQWPPLNVLNTPPTNYTDPYCSNIFTQASSIFPTRPTLTSFNLRERRGR